MAGNPEQLRTYELRGNNILNDFSEAQEERLSQSMKLKKTCLDGTKSVWYSQEIEYCPKQGRINR
jgi:hypothetical protein